MYLYIDILVVYIGLFFWTKHTLFSTAKEMDNNLEHSPIQISVELLFPLNCAVEIMRPDNPTR